MSAPPPGSPSQANQPQVYQIDFTAVASGKRIASTKRRVRWRFGFANPEALAAGQTGTDCRGEEHDVTIVWSITSGKRLVLADGQEVHYSNSRNNVFDFSWTMRGNHVLKIVAHASPPLNATPGFRQYDFFVDGQSFFTFPKVFRLGLGPNDPRSSGPGSTPNMAVRYNGGGGGGGSSSYRRADAGSTRSRGSATNIANIEAPHNPDEEEAYLQEAIKNSLKETHTPTQGSRPAITSGGQDLLLDFMGGGAPAPAPAALPPSTASSSYGSDFFGAAPAIEQQPAFAALPPSTSAPPAQPEAYGSALVAAPGPADPWGSAVNPYGAPPPGPSDPYVAPPIAAAVAIPGAQYGAPPTTPGPSAQDPYGSGVGGGSAPTAAAVNPYGLATPQPQSQQQQQQQQQFATPMPSSIAGTPQDFTPATQASSIGFASPVAQPFGAQGDGGAGPAPASFPATDDFSAAPESSAPSDPALLSMNVLSGQDHGLVTDSMAAAANGTSNGSAPAPSLVDQAYAKLVNMDAFDLVQDKGADSRSNPFDMAANGGKISGGTASLSDMKSQNSSKAGDKKPIMRSHAPDALVVSNTQNGNFGGYGGSMGGSMGQPPPAPMQQGGMGMQAPLQQQQPPPPMSMYGQPNAMQPQQGYQQPPPPQGCGMPPQQQPAYGQQPPFQQQAYGQPPQSQQQQYPPPLQQQPFGF